MGVNAGEVPSDPSMCVDSTECEDGALCSEDQCRPCQEDAECQEDSLYGAGATCHDGQCISCEVGSEGCTCDDARQCDSGLRCADDVCEVDSCEDATACTDSRVCLEGICSPCATDEHCQDTMIYGLGARCVEGECICPAGERGCACEDASDGEDRVCGQGLICNDEGVCEDLTCEDASTCGALVCVEGLCQPCASDEACREAGIYGVSARCVDSECVCVVGSEGCPCDAEELCDRGLICDIPEGASSDEVPRVCVVDRCAQGEPGEVEGCPCDDESSCVSTLECLPDRFSGEFRCEERVGMLGGLCDIGQRCDRADQGEGFELTCQEGRCVCVEGGTNCACDDQGSCRELSCTLTEGRLGVCTECVGELGCYCDLGAMCSDGLDCDESGICVLDGCAPGTTGCRCDASRECEADNDLCIPLNEGDLCVTCVGQEGCICGIGRRCDDGLTCDVSGRCAPPCPAGETGCPCSDEGLCLSELEDLCYAPTLDETPICTPNLIGTEGFPCGVGAQGNSCEGALVCNPDGVCCQEGTLDCLCDPAAPRSCEAGSRCVTELDTSACRACSGEVDCSCDDEHPCQEGECAEGRCQILCPERTLGCPCGGGEAGPCDGDLVCEGEVCAEPSCPILGVEGCPCDNGVCQPDLSCGVVDQTPTCVPCAELTPRALACSCEASADCESDRCLDGRCAPACDGALALEGCSCADSACVLPLSCDDQTQRCVDRSGELGHPCAAGQCADLNAVCDPSGLCCERGALDCVCDEGTCQADLTCRLGSNDPEAGLCADCQGEEGCVCEADDDCALGAACLDGRCGAPCDGRDGEAGCVCLESTACADPSACQPAERCGFQGRCEVNTSGVERCVSCLGEEGCLCLENQECLSGLTCQVNGRCVFDPPCEEIGAEGCRCDADQTCDAGLTCRLLAGAERCVECEGLEGCPCAADQSCFESYCSAQDICECPPGQEWCDCDAEGACQAGLSCVGADDERRCIDCRGDEGCTCQIGGICNDPALSCSSDQICVNRCLLEPQSAGCPCAEDGVCSGDLNCRPDERGDLICVDCLGAEGCYCDRGASCDGELACVGGLCLTPCTSPGEAGCLCQAESDCAAGLNCRDEGSISACRACLGEEGCSCLNGGCSSVGVECVQGYCVSQCEPGSLNCRCDVGACDSADARCVNDECISCLGELGCSCAVGAFCQGSDQGETRCESGVCVPDACVDDASCISAGLDGFLCLDGVCRGCTLTSQCEQSAHYRAGSTCERDATRGLNRCIPPPEPCDPDVEDCACESTEECDGEALTAGMLCAQALCTLCETDEACATDHYGLGARCLNGRCQVCPPGTLDCPCDVGGECGGELECEAGSCVVPRCPVAGVDGCPCDNGTCQEGSSCLLIEEQPTCVPCAEQALRALTCACDDGAQCASDRCLDGRCAPPCEEGLIGCSCVETDCVLPLSCDAQTQRCVDRSGETGHPCAAGQCADVNAECNAQGFCCERGTIDCGCDEESCQGGLTCRLSPLDPINGICADCQGERGCLCQTDGDCALDAPCVDGRCAAPCTGREGEAGCLCRDEASCVDPNSCQQAERCDFTGYCEVNDSGNERCVSCLGEEGCLCLEGQACLGDLSCQADGRCANDPPCEDFGAEGCVCYADQSCDEGLDCQFIDGYNRCVQCAGRLGCECALDGSCVDSYCNDQGVCDCPPGLEGCACDAAGQCEEGIDCVERNGSSSCVDCLGELGCSCGIGARCNDAELRCSGGLCVERCLVEAGTEACGCAGDADCDERLNCRPNADHELVCTSCQGQEGCDCGIGAICDAGLTCSSGRCLRPCVNAGGEGCLCQDEGDCGQSLNCRDEGDVNICRSCLGQEGCYCGIGASCNAAGLQCYQNYCVSICDPGTVDCRCDAGSCAGTNVNCIDDVCTSCVGELGCSCAAGAACEGDARCEGGICVPNSCSSAMSCIRAGLEGFLCIDGTCQECGDASQCGRSSAYGRGSTCEYDAIRDLNLCVPPPSACDPNLEVCECASASDCDLDEASAGMVCIEFTCQPCRVDENCVESNYYGGGSRCIEGRCAPWESPCELEDDPVCACQDWTDCQDSEQTYNMLCVESECRPCLSDEMCETFSRFGAGSVCESGRCLLRFSCDPNLESCECERSSDCDIDPQTRGMVCVEFECRPCTNDQNCQQTAQYGPTSTCDEGRCSSYLACSTSADCDRLAEHIGELCIDGECLPCSSDALCQRSTYYGVDSMCITGQCQ